MSAARPHPALLALQLTARVALVLAALAPSAARGREIWRRGDASLRIVGSLREIGQVGRGTTQDDFVAGLARDPTCVSPATFADCAAFDRVDEADLWSSLTRLRIELDATLRPELTAVVAYDQQFQVGVLDTLGEAISGERPDTFLGLEGDIHLFGLGDDTDRRRWSQRLYRGYVRWDDGRVAATVGRQRIPWGVGRLWNPIDRFNPIGPLAIEPDESPGVDAVDLRWLFSGFRYVQLVYAPGTRARDTRVALRAQGVVHDVDASAMVGIFEEARVAGFDLTGNLGDAAWRTEVVWTDPERDVWPLDAARPREPSPYWQIVAGLDGNLDVGSGLYWLVEHLYNGAALGFGEGDAGRLAPLFGQTLDRGEALLAPPGSRGPWVRPADDAIFEGSGVVSFAHHTTGAQLGYDLGVAWRADLLVLWDWNGGSAAFFPTLRYTGWNFGDVTLGAQLFAGPDASQFGGQPPRVYLLAEVFF